MKIFLLALATTIALVLTSPRPLFADENITTGTKYRLKDFKSFFDGSNPSDAANFTPCGKYFWTALSTEGKMTFFVGERFGTDGFGKSEKRIFVGGGPGQNIPLAIDGKLPEPIIIRETGVQNPRYTVWMNLRDYLSSPCLIRGEKI